MPKSIDTYPIIKWLVFGIVAISIAAVPISPVLLGEFSTHTDYLRLGDLWLLAAFVPVAAAAYFFLGKYLAAKSQRFTLVSISLLSIVLYLLVLFNCYYVTYGDFGFIRDAAWKMAAGEYDARQFADSDYMRMYNWQTGMAVLQSVFMRIFDIYYVYVIKAFNCVCQLCTTLMIYFLAKRHFGKEVATFAALAAAIHVPYILSIAELSNQQTTAPLLLLSLYLYEGKHRFYAGVCAGVANVMRPIGIIILLSVLCYEIFLWLRKYEKWQHIKRFATFAIGMYAVLFIFDAIAIGVNYADSPLSSAQLPYYKFHSGFTGYINPSDDIARMGGIDNFNEWEKQQISNALTKDLATTAAYVGKKMIFYLGFVDDHFIDTFGRDFSIIFSPHIRIWYLLGWAQYLVLLCIAMYAIVKRRAIHIPLFAIFFIGNTLVYVFIEACTSYRFPHYLYLFILAAQAFALPKDQQVER